MSNASANRLTSEYRLYPRRVEQRRLEAMLEQGREGDDAALQPCKIVYETTGKGIGALSQWDSFRERRKPAGILLNASRWQHLLRRLDQADRACFGRIQAGEAPGPPRFKGQDRFNRLENTYGAGVSFGRAKRPGSS
jgi:putative transposase